MNVNQIPNSQEKESRKSRTKSKELIKCAPFWIQKVTNSLIVDLHVRYFDLVQGLRVTVCADMLKQCVTKARNNPLLFHSSHHRIRLPRPFKTQNNNMKLRK